MVLQHPEGKPDAEVEVGKLGPADYFGEIALLFDKPRAVRTLSRTMVLVT